MCGGGRFANLAVGTRGQRFERIKDCNGLREGAANAASVLTDHAVKIAVFFHGLLHELFQTLRVGPTRVGGQLDLMISGRRRLAEAAKNLKLLQNSTDLKRFGVNQRVPSQNQFTEIFEQHVVSDKPFLAE